MFVWYLGFTIHDQTLAETLFKNAECRLVIMPRAKCHDDTLGEYS